MTPDVATATLPGQALALALVLEPALADALFTVSVLTSLGFQVTVADCFQEAKQQLLVRPPALLVTELRLAAYNGLHLVLRGTATHPGMAAIVTSTIADPVLQVEAERLGATYVHKPLSAAEFAAAVTRTLHRAPDAAPLHPPYERRGGDRRHLAGGALTLVASERRRGERRRAVGASAML